MFDVGVYSTKELKLKISLIFLSRIPLKFSL